STAGNGVFTTLGEQEKMLIGSLSSGGETLTGQIGEASKFLDAVKSATAKQAITPAQDVSLTQNVLGAEIQAVNAEASKFQANGASITASDQTQLKDQLAALNQQYAAFGNPDMGTASGQQKNLLKTQLDQLSTTINGLQVADSSGGTTTPTPVTLGGGVPAPSSGQGNDPNAGSTGSSSGGSQSGSSSTDNSLPTTGGSSDSGAPAGGGTHTVVHGDTMWGIARASGMPLSKLEALNPQIKNPELIFPGQQINLGGASDASVTSGGGSTGTDAGGTHTVVHGDTMWGIAQSNGMPLSKLEALNPQIKNPELITPGQQLNLGGTPAAASTPAAGATDGSDGSAVTQSSAVFPRSSSYQTPGAASQTETSADAKPSGWANGSSSVPSDPAKGVIEVVTNPTTDPLKINQNKGHSV
ncbi:MAG TPA: LysM domain-containing protein, partial [Candidatus Saccharimonadales bacterium]